MKFTVLGIMQCVYQMAGNLRGHLIILINTETHPPSPGPWAYHFSSLALWFSMYSP